jgi:zinc protease
MVVEMLKEGTRTRSSKDIAESLDQAAIDFECDVSMEHVVIAMTMLSAQLQSGLELLSDIVRNPSFPEVEFEKVKARWKGNLLSQRSDPAFLANERIFKEIFALHPYAKTSIPVENIRDFSSDLLREFFERQFTPSGTFLMLAGSITPDEGEKFAGDFFGDWPGRERPQIDFPPLETIEKPLYAMVDRPHSAQTKVLVGLRTVPHSSPALMALKLANQILGGSASARLFLNLREEKGYTYGAYSFQKNYKREGVILGSANVRTENAKESVEEICLESARMGKELPAEKELSRSKSEIIGSFLRQLETPGSVGSLEVLRLLLELPVDYYMNYIPTIRSLAANDVLTVSEQYLNPRHMFVVLVGDRKSLAEQFEGMGEIRYYDIHGNRLG